MGLLILLLICNFSIGQDIDPFAGTWEGELTHEGGYAPSYAFNLNLKKVGEYYVGTSVVRVDDIYAEMTITGEAMSNQLLIIKDVEIKRHSIKNGMEWCLKSYQILLSNDGYGDVMQGTWQGKTSFSNCIPGKLSLRRAQNRA